MPSIQPMFGTFHLHSLVLIFLHMGTSPSLAMLGKSVVDMHIMTCCKWSNELKIRLLWLILWSSQQFFFFHSCIHLQWSHFYKCLFNLCFYCYHESASMDRSMGLLTLKHLQILEQLRKPQQLWMSKQPQNMLTNVVLNPISNHVVLFVQYKF
jgi:hypothetical protein